MPLYRISGMMVLSEFVLPGAWTLASGEPDVVMRRGRVPQSLADPITTTPRCEIDRHHILLRCPGIGRFLVSHGREVVVESEDGVSLADCAVYLQGTVIGMLLVQRGDMAMHASAIAVDGKAILFCGISGAGKSTLAAAMSLRGYDVISDDVSAIAFDAAGCPRVYADGRKLKLTDQSIRAMGLDARRGEPVLGNSQKTYVRPQCCWAGADLPLGAIYVLLPRSKGIAIMPLAPTRALKELHSHAFRPRLVQRMGQAAHYFVTSAKIVQRAGVFMVDRERDLSRLAETVAIIENHWNDIGFERRYAPSQEKERSLCW